MNIAVALLHIDCPSRAADHAAPPKLQMIGYAQRLYGCCPACRMWVTVDITPAADPQLPQLLDDAMAGT